MREARERQARKSLSPSGYLLERDLGRMMNDEYLYQQ
jgi:hypothetical protein